MSGIAELVHTLNKEVEVYCGPANGIGGGWWQGPLRQDWNGGHDMLERLGDLCGLVSLDILSVIRTTFSSHSRYWDT